MRIIQIPKEYVTPWGCKRTVLKRGNRCSLEAQEKGAPFIVRKSCLEYSNAMDGFVEHIPSNESYSRFQTKAEAEVFFANVEDGKIDL